MQKFRKKKVKNKQLTCLKSVSTKVIMTLNISVAISRQQHP